MVLGVYMNPNLETTKTLRQDQSMLASFKVYLNPEEPTFLRTYIRTA